MNLRDHKTFFGYKGTTKIAHMQAFGYFLPNKMKLYLLHGAMRRLCSHKNGL